MSKNIKTYTECEILVKQFWEQIKNEKKLFVTIPLLIALLLACWLNNFLNLIEGFELKNFIKDYLTIQITIITLFISFSITYVTILATGTGTNIEKLKATKSKKATANGKNIYLYQILLNNFTYNILVQAIILIISFLHFFIMYFANDIINIIATSIQFGLVLHIIILTVTNMLNVYFAFWDCKNN